MADKTSVDTSDRNVRDEEMFATLTADQISRIAVHGRARRVEQGDVPIEAGEETARLFVVTAGQNETSAVSGTVPENRSSNSTRDVHRRGNDAVGQARARTNNLRWAVFSEVASNLA
jgi:hypothetical protein